MSCVPGASFHMLHCLFCRKNANSNNINYQKENYVHYIKNKINTNNWNKKLKTQNKKDDRTKPEKVCPYRQKYLPLDCLGIIGTLSYIAHKVSHDQVVEATDFGF